MASKPNEVGILKATSTKLDDNHILILALLFHTADKEAKNAGDKSFYRYVGSVLKIDNLKETIKTLTNDENALKTWAWPTKISWWKPEYFLSYDGINTNKRGAKWLQDRIQKALPWNKFLELTKEGIKHTARGIRQSNNAKYDLENYNTEQPGLTISITTPEELLTLENQTFTKEIIQKRDLPKVVNK